MPLSVNIGLSRKASENYQSQGTSINLTAELDQSLLARPEELQQQIDALYDQAQQALDRQSIQPEPAKPVSGAGRRYDNGRNGKSNSAYRNGNGQNGAGNNGNTTNGNGQANSRRTSNGGGGGSMTDSQRKAIHAIAGRLHIDAGAEARDIIGEDLNHLTIRQASELIDHLKSLQPAGN